MPYSDDRIVQKERCNTNGRLAMIKKSLMGLLIDAAEGIKQNMFI